MDDWEAALSDPAVKEQMLLELTELMMADTRAGTLTKAQWEPSSARWENLYPVVPDFIYEPSPEDSFAALALATGTPVLELVYDHMAQNGAEENAVFRAIF